MVFNNAMNNYNDEYYDEKKISVPSASELVEISKANATENILTEYYKKIYEMQLIKNICENEELVKVYKEYQSLKDE
jgi:hypothetical protein